MFDFTVIFEDDKSVHLKSLEEIFQLENKDLIKTAYLNMKKLTELPKEISALTKLSDLQCNENQLITIPQEIGQLVNLRELNLNHNILTELPKEIGLLRNLKALSLVNNRLTELPQEIGLLRALSFLDCERNQLKEIPKEIGNLSNLKNLYISYNNIIQLPLEIIQCRRLTILKINGNPMELHPLISRFIHQMNNYTNHNVFSDTQNIHNSVIQKSTSDSIFNILKDPLEIDNDLMIKELIENPVINCQPEILDYLTDPSLHSTIGITFKDLMLSVWNRIRKSEHFEEICLRINEELKESECKCFTGRLTRLLNSLSGFYEDISIRISSVDEISNVIRLTIEKYGANPEMLEVIREQATKELISRGYSYHIIKDWIENIEL